MRLRHACICHRRTAITDHAPKGRKETARGHRPGINEFQASRPEGAEPGTARLACGRIAPFQGWPIHWVGDPGAAPRAITACPFGAEARCRRHGITSACTSAIWRRRRAGWRGIHPAGR
jgi:hypothetical protein